MDDAETACDADMTYKYTVYSCNIGAYDEPVRLRHMRKDVRYLYFTDNATLSSSTWDVRHVVLPTDMSPHMFSRHIKFFPHHYIKDQSISLYIDAHAEIIDESVYDRLDELVRSGCLIAMPRHKQRNCAYEEARCCIELQKDTPENVNKAVKFLRERQYPVNNGLFAAGCLYRRHDYPVIQSAMTEWWELLNQYSKRDQILLPYVLSKHGISVEDWNKGVVTQDTWAVGMRYRRHRHKMKKPSFLQRLQNSIRKRYRAIRSVLGLTGGDA